jgi:hypothetical protein
LAVTGRPCDRAGKRRDRGLTLNQQFKKHTGVVVNCKVLCEVS